MSFCVPSSSLVANFRNCWESADTLRVHAAQLIDVLVPDDGGGPFVHQGLSTLGLSHQLILDMNCLLVPLADLLGSVVVEEAAQSQRSEADFLCSELRHLVCIGEFHWDSVHYSQFFGCHGRYIIPHVALSINVLQHGLIVKAPSALVGIVHPTMGPVPGLGIGDPMSSVVYSHVSMCDPLLH